MVYGKRIHQGGSGWFYPVSAQCKREVTWRWSPTVTRPIHSWARSAFQRTAGVEYRIVRPHQISLDVRCGLNQDGFFRSDQMAPCLSGRSVCLRHRSLARSLSESLPGRSCGAAALRIVSQKELTTATLCEVHHSVRALLQCVDACPMCRW